MTSTDNDRRILHSALEAACGPRPAEILMEHLPPAGWRDLVTKDDLVLARSGIQLEIEKLRTEFIERIEQGFRSQTWRLIGALIASQSTTVGAIALFLR